MMENTLLSFACLFPHGESGLKWLVTTITNMPDDGLFPHGESGLKCAGLRTLEETPSLFPHGESGLKLFTEL